MNLEFLPEARGEFVAAVEFYEDKEPGLGRRFKNEIEEACAAIVGQCSGASMTVALSLLPPEAFLSLPTGIDAHRATLQSDRHAAGKWVRRAAGPYLLPFAFIRAHSRFNSLPFPSKIPLPLLRSLRLFAARPLPTGIDAHRATLQSSLHPL